MEQKKSDQVILLIAAILCLGLAWAAPWLPIGQRAVPIALVITVNLWLVWRIVTGPPVETRNRTGLDTLILGLAIVTVVVFGVRLLGLWSGNSTPSIDLSFNLAITALIATAIRISPLKRA